MRRDQNGGVSQGAAQAASAADGGATPRLALRVRRGDRLLGSWSLADEPVEIAVVDMLTGREVGTFVARGALSRVDEVPLESVQRMSDDDLTMPLPEQTEPTVEPSVTDDPRPGHAKAGAANLALGPRGGRAPGDDLTLPAIEASLVKEQTGLTSELQDETEELSLELDHSVVSSRGVTRPSEPPLIEPAKHRAAPSPASTPSAPRVSPALQPATGAPRRSSAPLPLAPMPAPRAAPAPVAPAPPPKAPPAPSPVAAPPPSPAPRVQKVEARPAEVWVRRRNEWRNAGSLVPGQRVPMIGGWVRLDPDGRLVVCPGEAMAGSATLLDGRTVEIQSGQDAIRLPPGASVLLRSGEQGLYVRSEPVLEAPARPAPAPAQPRR